MAKLKLTPIADDKPGKVTVELPARLNRDLARYAAYLNSQHVFVSKTGGEQCRI
ncbi:MAG: DUF2274 domain-containing protein [Mesorhizobium sp.]|nr:MAG: DUF2274 domain-containing protein [Mesorhizobium sp.]RWG85063.1 MAG: DUF2274 domain-containing protein [Mesorhizobium sp.]RWK16739.1 MAG: DUF2274 domain-containing protein [Mesorhizobium sp.]TIQ43235.1 MAG: DUF2274 domain-containing protein [Mesorhizobium sp.]TIQ53574.1 MAG: DUF2274 domain-containing protein [Mesorhizobium sp.]